MVTIAVIDAQLKAAGCNVRLWGRSELRELCDILLPGETIAMVANGQYDAGFAMLVATDFRILLIDKKPKYLTLKDIRFDMITELDYANRLLNSTMRIFTPNRELRFTAWSPTRLRKLFSHTQHKVMEIRHHYMMQQFQNQLDKNTPPGLALAMQKYDSAVDVEEVEQGKGQERQLQAAGGPGAKSAHHDEHGKSILPRAYGWAAHELQEEHRKLAAMMGATGVRAIVHNGRVIKDYMTVPFTQRWRKRPYGYTKASIGQMSQPAGT